MNFLHQSKVATRDPYLLSIRSIRSLLESSKLEFQHLKMNNLSPKSNVLILKNVFLCGNSVLLLLHILRPRKLLNLFIQHYIIYKGILPTP